MVEYPGAVSLFVQIVVHPQVLWNLLVMGAACNLSDRPQILQRSESKVFLDSGIRLRYIDMPEVCQLPGF